MHNYFGDGQPGGSRVPFEFLRDPNITGMFFDSGIVMGFARTQACTHLLTYLPAAVYSNSDA